MKSELSILIPTYNYNVFPLVRTLHEQLKVLGGQFEVLVYDDHSSKFHSDNEKINSLSGCRFRILEKNIGRSAIRNKLATDATHDLLLFLDADTKVEREDFVSNYLNAVDTETEIIYGGITYQTEAPPKNQLLRWKYGKSREALAVSERQKQPHLRFLTLNFLIRKKIFDILKFNEAIPNLRHEDTLFALDSKKKGIKITHIDNPVTHLGLESSEVFLKKSRESVAALELFVRQGLIDAGETALSAKAAKIKKTGFGTIVLYGFNIFRKAMEQNLLSGNPSLFIFDLYRLGYYLTISNNQK
jgi:glycosyltransferase involved in cell wall biosynthesis